jgi:hypothetical protein
MRLSAPLFFFVIVLATSPASSGPALVTLPSVTKPGLQAVTLTTSLEIVLVHEPPIFVNKLVGPTTPPVTEMFRVALKADSMERMEAGTRAME